MVKAIEIPVIADCNTGFGNAINVIHMTRDYESAGVAGICIEDNCFPKRCSLYDRNSRELVSTSEMMGKIEAAKHAQRDPDLVVVARVEALIAGHGVTAALERGNAYAAAGADAVVIHAKSWTLLEEVVKRWESDCPLVAIPTLYGHVSLSELQRAGFGLAIFPNQAVRAAVRAMRSALQTIRSTGLGDSVEAEIAPLSEIYELVDLPGLETAERRFLRGGEPGPEVAAEIFCATEGRP
jgi:phosphoenolpyruvate phosphomutase